MDSILGNLRVARNSNNIYIFFCQNTQISTIFFIFKTPKKASYIKYQSSPEQVHMQPRGTYI